MAEIVCLTCPFIACILLILYFEPYPKILTFYANETRRNKQVSKMGITDPNDCLVLNLNHLIKSSSGKAAIPFTSACMGVWVCKYIYLWHKK